jgi:hypothetical protein
MKIFCALLILSSSVAQANAIRYFIKDGRPTTIERGMTEMTIDENHLKIKNGLSAYENGIELVFSEVTHRYEFKSDSKFGEECTSFGCTGIDSFSGYLEAGRVFLTVKFFEDDGEPNLKYFKEKSSYLAPLR